MFDHLSPPALFFFFFFKWTIIPIFMSSSVYSCSASCGWVFPDKLRMSSFPNRFPHYTWTAAWSACSDFVGSRVYACLGVTCQLHFLVEWPGSFTCQSGSTGVEWPSNKSQHTKLTLEKKILPPLLPGFELATYRSRVRRSYQQAIPAPRISRYKRAIQFCYYLEI